MRLATTASTSSPELFLEHLGEARASADEAFNVAERLAAGDHGSWRDGATGMLSDLRGLLGNAASSARQATAYLTATDEAVLLAGGALDALTAADQLLASESGTPQYRASQSLGLIDDSRSLLWESWIVAGGPND